MNDPAEVGKWDRTSLTYDWMNTAEHRRLAPFKRALFQRAKGRVLLVGAGTGQDFELLPAGCDVIAIDISPAMVELAQERAAGCRSSVSVVAMDVQDLAFANGAFDTVLAVCVFCSVARPASGLLEVRRVLRPGGRLLMIEHVRSRLGPIAMMQDLMTVLSRWVGPDMNRDTVQTLVRCGFRLAREENIYLDIIKSVEAR